MILLDQPYAPRQVWYFQALRHFMVLKLINDPLLIPSAPEGNVTAEIIFATGQQVSARCQWWMTHKNELFPLLNLEYFHTLMAGHRENLEIARKISYGHLYQCRHKWRNESKQQWAWGECGQGTETAVPLGPSWSDALGPSSYTGMLGLTFRVITLGHSLIHGLLPHKILEMEKARWIFTGLVNHSQSIPGYSK